MRFLYIILEYKSYIIGVVDFLLLFLFFLSIYKFIRETKSLALVRGFLFIAVAYMLSYVFGLKTIVWLLNFLAPSVITGTIVIFQSEFRVALAKLGSFSFFNRKKVVDTQVIKEILEAAQYLSLKKRGALIVFEKNLNLSHIKLGIELNSTISKELIITIFEHDNPLHDGAIIIQNNKISYASCILPLTSKENISQQFGTRHRAAIGISESSDVVVLVVSEETTAISLVYSSVIYYDLEEKEVLEHLYKLLTNEELKPETKDYEKD